MFPVHTGINRMIVDVAEAYRDVPCTHRDKPIKSFKAKEKD